MYSSVGYSLVSPSNGKDTSGISTNTNLSYRFTKAVVTIGVFQDFRQTSVEGQDFGIVQTRGYIGSLLYTFTPLVTGFLEARYSNNETTGVGNNPSSPSTSNLTATAGLNWTISSWLFMRVDYTYTLRNNGGSSVTGSGNSRGDVTENRATLSFFATF